MPGCLFRWDCRVVRHASYCHGTLEVLDVWNRVGRCCSKSPEALKVLQLMSSLFWSSRNANMIRIWFDYFVDPIHSRRCNVVMSHPDSTYVFFSMFDHSLSTHISPWWPGANADGRHRSSAQSRWYPRAADDGGAVDTAVLSVSN